MEALYLDLELNGGMPLPDALITADLDGKSYGPPGVQGFGISKIYLELLLCFSSKLPYMADSDELQPSFCTSYGGLKKKTQLYQLSFPPLPHSTAGHESKNDHLPVETGFSAYASDHLEILFTRFNVMLSIGLGAPKTRTSKTQN